MVSHTEVISRYTPDQLREYADRLTTKAAQRKEAGIGGYGMHTLIIAMLHFCANTMEGDRDGNNNSADSNNGNSAPQGKAEGET